MEWENDTSSSADLSQNWRTCLKCPQSFYSFCISPSNPSPFLHSFLQDTEKNIHSSKVFPLFLFLTFENLKGKLSDVAQKFLETQSWPLSGVPFPSVTNSICNRIRKGLWWSFPASCCSLYRTVGESSGTLQIACLHFKVCVNLWCPWHPVAISCGILCCRVSSCVLMNAGSTQKKLVWYHLCSSFIQGDIEYLLHLYPFQDIPEFITLHGIALSELDEPSFSFPLSPLMFLCNGNIDVKKHKEPMLGKLTWCSFCCWEFLVFPHQDDFWASRKYSSDFFPIQSIGLLFLVFQPGRYC